MNNLVSIIIPAFHRTQIGETLESILSQTYHNWVLVVEFYLIHFRVNSDIIVSNFNKPNSSYSTIIHLDVIRKLIENLRFCNKVTHGFRLHSIKQLMPYLPIVYRDHGAFSKLIIILKSLLYLSESILLCLIKFRLAIISYTMFDERYFLLR